MNSTISETTAHKNDKVRLVYILAASHSGSTLLAMLLGAHPEICTVGELKINSKIDTDNYRCSCTKMIKECEFWKNIESDMVAKGFYIDIPAAPNMDIFTVPSRYARRILKPLYRGGIFESLRDVVLSFSPTWRTRLPYIQKVNVAMIESIIAETRKKVMVDSSKVAIRLKYLLLNNRLDIRVLWLIRDGRGVAITHTNPALFADADDPKFRAGGSGRENNNGISIDEAVQLWKRSNIEAEAILGTMPSDRWLAVHYEDLCINPSKTLRQIFSFIGVDEKVSYDEFKSKEHHVIGNGMRFDLTSEIRLDERWKSILREEELKVFDQIAGDLNRRYGYR